MSANAMEQGNGNGSGHGIPAREWEGRPAEFWRDRWRVPVLHVYTRTGSTNDVARRLAEAGAPHGTAVLADEQTAGRGRRGRSWHAPPGSALLLSLVLRPRASSAGPPAAAVIPLLVGLGVARAVECVAGVRAGIKWPNDLLLPDGRKIAGILCEGALGPPDGFLVAGIGVNVAQRPDDWSPELRGRAASLAQAVGRAVPRAELAGAIIAETLRLAARAGDRLEPEDARDLADRDCLHGRTVHVDGARGTAAGIAPDGALLLRRADGSIVPIRAGTVRPAAPETEAGAGAGGSARPRRPGPAPTDRTERP